LTPTICRPRGCRRKLAASHRSGCGRRAGFKARALTEEWCR
jgi:hypothetical protein